MLLLAYRLHYICTLCIVPSSLLLIPLFSQQSCRLALFHVQVDPVFYKGKGWLLDTSVFSIFLWRIHCWQLGIILVKKKRRKKESQKWKQEDVSDPREWLANLTNWLDRKCLLSWLSACPVQHLNTTNYYCSNSFTFRVNPLSTRYFSSFRVCPREE